MSVKLEKTIIKECTVTDSEGNVLGKIQVEEKHFLWKPDDGDGWSEKEIETMYQRSVEYNVYSQKMRGHVTEDHS